MCGTATPQALVGIDVHALGGRQTGVANYVQAVISALPPEARSQVLLYTDRPASPVDGFAFRRVGPGALWTTVRLSLHFLRRRPPPVFWFPAHAIPLYAPSRCVVTVHDLAFEYMPGHFSRSDIWRLRSITRHALRRAHRILAVSEATRDDLQRLFPWCADRVTVIHAGCDEKRFRDVSTEHVELVCRRFGIPRPYVLAVGTLQSRKNHERLLCAWERVAAHHPSASLVLAGGMGWRGETVVQAISRSRYRDRVRWLDFVDSQDLPALYAGAAVFVMPSIQEGFGLPLLEAMAAGVPAVASTTPALAEVAGDAALLVPADDEAGWAHAITAVLMDQEVGANLRKVGRERVRQFTWERTARATWDVLRQAGETIPVRSMTRC